MLQILFLYLNEQFHMISNDTPDIMDKNSGVVWWLYIYLGA